MRPALLLALLFASASLDAAQAGADEKERDYPVVEVTGYAYEDVKPDWASVSFGILVDEPTAAEAAAEIAKRGQALAAEIRAAGVESKDIRTSSLRVDPVYAEDRDPKTQRPVARVLTGFRASDNLIITTRDVDHVGALVTRLLANHANTLRQVDFGVEADDDIRAALLGKAVADARRKATLLAEGASMRLGPVAEIDFGAGGGEADMPTLKRFSDAGPVSLVIPVEPGVQRLSESVRTRWRLLEK